MKKLKIAFYSTNEFSCPLPKEIIYAPMDLAEMVVKELDRRGHDVTLYTSEDSKIEMKKVTAGMTSYYKLKDKATSGGFHDQLQMTLYEQLLASKMYEDSQKGKFDIIHAYHLVPKILPFVNLTKTPTVFTLHDPMDASWNKMINFCQWKNRASYISISDNQRKGMPDLNYVKTVYNGLDLKNFKFQKKPQDYLAFLGRYSKEKGIDVAVQVAIKSKEKLKMAGNIWGGGFYDERVKPFLKKGEVEDIGFLDRKKLSSFLGGAKALLFPINWEEPFGLVMIEAMACGTPVIAFNRGSVSEVVKHGKTGFVVENEKEMIETIQNIDQIKREDCRAHVEENFTIKTMVDGYEEAYRRVLDGIGN
ncbi:glycosyltransferase family 4 protein [Candidatus Parcubacteria bacterium]|nr:glycosyltransferase family 4 protein [Candidatus Parcubacteria bacterium]